MIYNAIHSHRLKKSLFHQKYQKNIHGCLLTDKLLFDFFLFLLDLPVFTHHLLSDSASYKFSFYSTILLITSQPTVTWERVCDRSLKRCKCATFIYTCIMQNNLIAQSAFINQFVNFGNVQKYRYTCNEKYDSVITLYLQNPL